MKSAVRITAITSRSNWSGPVHAVSLAVAAAMFVYLVILLKPLYGHFVDNDDWVAVSYLAVACLVIPTYWPSVTYRLSLLLMYLTMPGKAGAKSFTQLENHRLPPVCIVVPTRNEPASIVIPLLESLTRLQYPDFELVLADNSDVVDAGGRINRDLVEIAEFAERHAIRFVRRASGPAGARLPAGLPSLLRSSGVDGDVRGGKAGNLNAALASADRRFGWFFILDSDSLLPEETLRQMVSIGVQGDSGQKGVGFVQSVLSSANQDESSLSFAQSVLDEIYYNKYFAVKAAVGVVSNWGHGILVARNAWQATKGFPLELSEDLAWANELLVSGRFVNYYALCPTLERKPATWGAFKIQRNRWAKGTTILLKKQLLKVWNSDRVRWSEKLDLTYDMTSYVFNAVGCLLPVFFLFSGVLGPAHQQFFRTLVPAFYVVMALDNLLVPLESVRMVRRNDTKGALRRLAALPYISVYLGAIASQIFLAVVSAFASRSDRFVVTPKARPVGEERRTIGAIMMDNKFCYFLFLINGWVTVSAWYVNPVIVPLLILSPIAYFLAPILSARSASDESLS